MNKNQKDHLIGFQRAASLGVMWYLHLLQEEEQQQEQQQQQPQQEQSKDQKKKRTPRCVWVKPYLLEHYRFTQGMYENLVKQLATSDFGIKGEYKNFMRMQPALFHELLEGIRPLISKQDTRMRMSITPEVRLAITLRFLASGENYPSLGFAFRVSRCTICRIVHHTCRAINQVFRERFIQSPTTKAGWKRVAEDFSSKWQFEHTLGALDGKHIRMRKPRKAGSWYYNYKGFHSIILLALADANYKLLWVDIGAEGRAGDAGVYNEGELKKAIKDKTINFPASAGLPNDDMKTPMPYFIVADDAFALSDNLMKPYRNVRRSNTWEEDVFNYRLSRARRIIENVFGILSHRFRCLLTTLQPEPVVVKEITMACCTLHNFLCTRNPGQVDAMPNLIR